jgi:hypothetical protein
MRTRRRTWLGVAAAVAVTLAGAPAFALTACEMRFDLDGWSAFYQASNGEGVVDCDNGQRAYVLLEGRGGGITFGRSQIVDGTGRFSPIADIEEIFGNYGNAEAHAGFGVSSKAQVVTKGPVSLTLSGTGTGVDLGFAFGRFTITPAGHRERRRQRGFDEDELESRPPPPREQPRDREWREPAPDDRRDDAAEVPPPPVPPDGY